MPYIASEDRREELMCLSRPETPGELNYVLTFKCLDYLGNEKLDYNMLNGIIGALECCKQEFYRRMGAPYEDTKIKLNGDVY